MDYKTIQAIGLEVKKVEVFKVDCPICNFNSEFSVWSEAYAYLNMHLDYHISVDPYRFHFLSEPGPATWHVCDACNYGGHTCSGCGDSIPHSRGHVCDDCKMSMN